MEQKRKSIPALQEIERRIIILCYGTVWEFGHVPTTRKRLQITKEIDLKHGWAMDGTDDVSVFGTILSGSDNDLSEILFSSDNLKKHGLFVPMATLNAGAKSFDRIIGKGEKTIGSGKQNHFGDYSAFEGVRRLLGGVYVVITCGEIPGVIKLT
jgi:hypothetical protein